MAGSPILEHVGDRNSVDGGARQIGLLDPEPGEVDVVNAPARHVDIVERAARHVDVMKVAAGQIHIFEARPREIGFINVETLFCAVDLHGGTLGQRDGRPAPPNASLDRSSQRYWRSGEIGPTEPAPSRGALLISPFPTF